MNQLNYSLKIIGLIFVSIFFIGCTHKLHTISPYNIDKNIAKKLENRAQEHCSAKHGKENVPLHKFKTDGCSIFPDSSWLECCVEHDINYWCGGNSIEREKADEELRSCLIKKEAPILSDIAYWGVRVGASPWLPFPWRWGYGWDWPKGYED